MLKFILIRLVAILVLLALFIWAPWILNPVYAVNGFIWSQISGLVLWALWWDESLKMSLWAILTAIDLLTNGADWVLGLFPGFGPEAQALLRFILNVTGILTDITLAVVGIWIVRKITALRRPRREVRHGY